MIIITGANGFIGSALVWELNQSGHRDLVCVDSVSLAERPGPLRGRPYKKFLLKDQIWDFLNLPESRSCVSTVLHMGACSSTTEMNVEFLNENNVEYTRRLWQWCTENQKKFIYASSGAVYGDGANGFDDASPPELFKPLNPYGESKASFDRWAVQQASMPPCWFGLRFFNVYGPGEYHKGEMASVVFKAYKQIDARGDLQLFRSHHPEYRDGEQMRDFVYVKDITRWILELMNRPDGQVKNKSTSDSGIYNMGNGRARTWLDLARAVFKSMHREMKIDWIDVPSVLRARYQYFTEAKIDRLLKLGLTPPQWDLEAGVRDYVTNYLARLHTESGGYL